MKASSQDGRALLFYNQSLSGGFVAQYADTREIYLSHTCYINGVKCYADEAHFGGIVIQVVEHTKPTTLGANQDPSEILFDAKGHAISHATIIDRIIAFGNSYNDAVKEIIHDSRVLDSDGKVFIKCASRILKNFGMTRSGPFHVDCNERLRGCWDVVGTNLKEINNSVLKSSFPRDRYLLEIGEHERELLIAEIWLITKKLLPFTMGKTSFGLVGASKILFSVLPEIVLPVDNVQWFQVFKTVDLGDVLRSMVYDIQKWESLTRKQFNNLDSSNRLTTLPSVYNVMAMAARPNLSGTEFK